MSTLGVMKISGGNLLTFVNYRDGCFSAHDLSSFRRELRERSTFLLSDSRTPDPYPAMTILVSSPSKKIIYVSHL